MNEYFTEFHTQSRLDYEKKYIFKISELIRHTEATAQNRSLSNKIFDLDDDNVSDENQFNDRRLKRFRSEFSKKLIKLIREVDFEYGLDNFAEQLVRKAILENNAVAKGWLNELFIEHIDDLEITTGILRIISHFEYHEIAPEGQTMAIAALANSNTEICECGIRALENWGTLHSLRILENTKCNTGWLNAYLQEVISDLKEEINI